MSQVIVTDGLSQFCSTFDHTDVYTLILKNCNYCLLSNSYSINHKLALRVLCKNNISVPEQVSTNRDC